MTTLRKSITSIPQKAVEAAVEAMLDEMERVNEEEGAFGGEMPRDQYRPTFRRYQSAALRAALPFLTSAPERALRIEKLERALRACVGAMRGLSSVSADAAKEQARAVLEKKA